MRRNTALALALLLTGAAFSDCGTAPPPPDGPVGPAVAPGWSPPLGIPVPPFGITQAAPSPPSPWSSAAAGFYYVDDSDPGATDAGNPYGAPAKPRRTIPTSLPAGSVVEVHGTYGFAHTSPRGIEASGTAAQPVYIRGASSSARPTITQSWEVTGSYLILENLAFAFQGKGLYLLAPSTHTALRQSEVRGNLDGGGIQVVSWNGSTTSHIVILGNAIHDNGDVDASYDQDVHGIQVGSHVNNVWILDNEIYRNSGDGIQINGSVTSLHHVYAGRNTSHHNKQSGMWTKSASDIVFSENEVHGHRPSGSSPGQGMGFQYDPRRVWFLFNEAYDNTVGMSSGSSSSGGRSQVYFIGNVLRNNTDAGIQLNGWVDGEYVIGNTFHGNPVGLENGYYKVGLEISNNIFSASSTAHVSFREYGAGAASNLRHSLFDAPVKIVWDDVARDVAGMQGIGECRGCRTGAPLFVRPTAGDYSLQAGSPAIDGGALEAAYATFQSLYGVDIARDRAGRTRPQGAAWDMGAYEFRGE